MALRQAGCPADAALGLEMTHVGLFWVMGRGTRWSIQLEVFWRGGGYGNGVCLGTPKAPVRGVGAQQHLRSNECAGVCCMISCCSVCWNCRAGEWDRDPVGGRS